MKPESLKPLVETLVKECLAAKIKEDSNFEKILRKVGVDSNVYTQKPNQKIAGDTQGSAINKKKPSVKGADKSTKPSPLHVGPLEEISGNYKVIMSKSQAIELSNTAGKMVVLAENLSKLVSPTHEEEVKAIVEEIKMHRQHISDMIVESAHDIKDKNMTPPNVNEDHGLGYSHNTQQTNADNLERDPLNDPLMKEDLHYKALLKAKLVAAQHFGDKSIKNVQLSRYNSRRDIAEYEVTLVNGDTKYIVSNRGMDWYEKVGSDELGISPKLVPIDYDENPKRHKPLPKKAPERMPGTHKATSWEPESMPPMKMAGKE